MGIIKRIEDTYYHMGDKKIYTKDELVQAFNRFLLSEYANNKPIESLSFNEWLEHNVWETSRYAKVIFRSLVEKANDLEQYDAWDILYEFEDFVHLLRGLENISSQDTIFSWFGAIWEEEREECLKENETR